MTVAPAIERKPTYSRKGYPLVPRWYGWPSHVVPTWQLAQYIERKRHLWQARYNPPRHSNDSLSYTLKSPNDDDGWRLVLSTDVGQILRQDEDSARRKLHNVLNNTAKIVYAQFADAICLSVGEDIERDAGLTVLPGCITVARDMIAERSIPAKLNLDDETRERCARYLLWLSAQIVSHPERHDKLVAKAPFDLLRSY